MPQYVAVVGNHPQLSIAELAALLPDFKVLKLEGKQAVLFETSAQLDGSFIDILGGSLFLAQQLSDKPVVLKDVPALLSAELATAKRKKATFSLRCYGLDSRDIRELYRACKMKLKKEGRPSRYVGSDKHPAQAVVLHQQGLLGDKMGCELTIISDEKGDIWVGRTIGAQNVDAYTKRDIEKPVRDTTVGLLPPKLAQMLLNLGVWASEQVQPAKKGEAKKWKLPVLTVLDPFCGTGVIPLECLVRGWSVLASDVSLKAVNGTTKNIEWIRKEMKILKKDADSEVWKQDATKPFQLKEKPNFIATETTLGPSLSDRPNLKDVSKWRTQLESLEADFLKNISQSLPGVPVVCIWPVWYHSKGKTNLEKVWLQLHEYGFKAALPAGTPSDSTGRTSLLYRRPDQNVGREIFVLLPTT